VIKKTLNVLLTASIALASLQAEAAQLLSGKPDDTMPAQISRHEPTLIRIDGAKIRQIFGTNGDYNSAPDSESGVVYIQPAPDKSAITVYVADDTGHTWKLLLMVTDAPTDPIVIKGRAPEAGSQQARGKDLARNQEIKNALFDLLSAGEDEATLTEDTIPLWKESKFVRVKVLEGNLLSEQFQLTNISKAPMVIDERELYRRGVLAVVVERPQLASGETTSVYIISESGQ
jgi:conjugal transfer pilus assembly protein TraK